MSLSNDNFLVLLNFKQQLKRWKLFALLLVLIVIFVLSISNKKQNTSSLNISKECIVSIDINGIILADKYREKILKKITHEKLIKAVIVNIDSPGGTVADSEILYSRLRDIAVKKPVVVLMGNVAASGGYMVSLASDYIIARNGTLTGSIGVILQSAEVTELAKRMGINFVTYKSSELKGSPSPFEKTNSKVDKAIMSSINDVQNFFMELVVERRKIDKNKITKIANGQVYTGRQALKHSLVDKIGNENDALIYLKSRGINISKLKIKEVSLEKKKDFGLLGDVLSSVFPFSKQKVSFMSSGFMLLHKF